VYCSGHPPPTSLDCCANLPKSCFPLGRGEVLAFEPGLAIQISTWMRLLLNALNIGTEYRQIQGPPQPVTAQRLRTRSSPVYA
jgi:hypothetical protein